MKRKIVKKRMSPVTRRRKSTKLHHRIISHFRGNGGIYSILVLGTVMAGAFALTGGILPQLNPNPPASSRVEIATESANESNEDALQLQDIKIKPTSTPTPTLTPPPVVPTEPLACLNKTAILLLVDLSASMEFDNKITELRRALRLLRDELRQETGVGIYGFGSYTQFSARGYKGVEELVQLNKYRDNKAAVDSVISSLTQGGLGGTYMRNGFALAIDRLQAAKNRTSYFKDYNFVTVVFSDGVPERSGDDPAADRNLGACAPYHANIDYQKCFAQEQDPRVDLTAQLKNEGKVYSVVVYDQRSSEDDSYFVSPRDSNDRLRTLMKNISSSSSNYYDVEVRGVTQLASAFQSIVNGICSQ